MDLDSDQENDSVPVEPGEELDGEDLVAIDEISLHEGKCVKPQCKRIRVNLVYQRGLAATREGGFWLAIFTFFLLFVLGLLVVMWIFPNLVMRNRKNTENVDPFFHPGERIPGLSFDPSLIFGSSFDAERRRNISNTFIFEEVYSATEARYFTFKNRANRSDAYGICSHYHSFLISIDSIEADKSLHDFIKKAYKDLPVSSLGLLWTGGIISSDEHEIIQWEDNALTFLNEKDQRLDEVEDGKLLWNNKGMIVSKFKKFCNESEAKALVRSSSTLQVYDVLVDLRLEAHCWVLKRQNTKEENNFICEATTEDSLRVYEVDPKFVGQTLSKKSNIFHKFFATKQPLIDTRRICVDEGGHLVTLSTFAEEMEFDSRLRSMKSKVFFNAPNETVNFFTAGWYLYSINNSTVVHWGRGHASYQNFCDGETKKANELFAADPAVNRRFVILKSYASSSEIEFAKSCWKLLPYREAKDSNLSSSQNYFSCQLKKN